MSDKRGMATGAGWWQENADRLMNDVQRIHNYVPAAADDILTTIGQASDRLNITCVTFVPDAAYPIGGLYLVNTGTAGADASTLASKTASDTTLSAGVPYTLTLGATVAVASGEWLALRRTTANGDTVPQGGAVLIEYELSDALKPS